jgi:hypothetical protein
VKPSKEDAIRVSADGQSVSLSKEVQDEIDKATKTGVASVGGHVQVPVSKADAIRVSADGQSVSLSKEVQDEIDKATKTGIASLAGNVKPSKQ